MRPWVTHFCVGFAALAEGVLLYMTLMVVGEDACCMTNDCMYLFDVGAGYIVCGLWCQPRATAVTTAISKCNCKRLEACHAPTESAIRPSYQSFVTRAMAGGCE